MIILKITLLRKRWLYQGRWFFEKEDNCIKDDCFEKHC